MGKFYKILNLVGITGHFKKGEPRDNIKLAFSRLVVTKSPNLTEDELLHHPLQPPTPYLIAIEDSEKGFIYFYISFNNRLTEPHNQINVAFQRLMQLYYIFNLEFPPSLKNFFDFFSFNCFEFDDIVLKPNASQFLKCLELCK